MKFRRRIDINIIEYNRNIIEIGISAYVCSWSFKCRDISFVKDTDFSKYLCR